MKVACITTHNEGPTIGKLVRELRVSFEKVIVVDAASWDTTRSEASRAGADVLFTESKLPIGPALLIAWERALRYTPSAILQIDAGGSHLAEDAPRLLAQLKHADVVLGSRFMAGAEYIGGQARRRIGSRVATMMCNGAQLGPHFTDWTSGYRAFTPQALRVLSQYEYRAKMHGWQIEVLAHAITSGLLITEVPIRYIAGRSSFNFRVAIEAYRVWEWMHTEIP